MNRGIRRGIGLDGFWPHNNASPNGASTTTLSNVPQLDASREGALGWGDTGYIMGSPAYGQVGGGLSVAGGLSVENGFAGLCFIATQGGGGGAKLDLRGTRQTLGAAQSPSLSGDQIAGINIGGGGTTHLNDCAHIDWFADENFDDTHSGAKVVFQNSTVGGTTQRISLQLNSDNTVLLAPAALTNTASRVDVLVGGNQTFATTSSMSHTAISYTATDTWSVAPLAFGQTFVGYNCAPTLINTAGSAVSAGSFTILSGSVTLTADTQTGLSANSNIGANMSPTVNVANSGTFTSGSWQGFKDKLILNGTGCTLGTVTSYQSDLTVTAGTVTTYTAHLVNNPTGAGAVTTAVGVDIAQITKGTTSIGFRCAGSMVYTPTVATVTSNAATVPVTVSHAKCTNSSAATCTITLATTNAVDGQELLVRYFDSSAASQTVTFTNSETGKAGAPPASLGSTTIPSTYRFIFNSGTSKWTYTGN